jgi:hypothetical protein
MANILHTYYTGVLRRLKSEVDLLNQIIPHNLTKGTENEQSLKKVVGSFIPRKYSLGSGIIIDSFGNQSRQADLVIYDSHIYPNLFSQSSTTIFPVETVIATIEVKTYLDNAKLKDVFQNTNSIRQLKHYEDTISLNQPDKDHPIKIMQYPTRPPLTGLFAFRVDSDSPHTWKERHLAYGNYDDMPEVSLLLDIATVFRFSDISQRSAESFQSLYYPLREKDTSPTGGLDQLLCTQSPQETFLTNDSVYKSGTFKIGEAYPIFMPERAFLSFLIALNILLDMYPKHISFDASKYLEAQYSHGQLL